MMQVEVLSSLASCNRVGAPAQARTHKEDVVTVADKTGTTQRDDELRTAHSHDELTARTEPVSNYAASFRVDQNPKEVFDAINDVRGWWGERRPRQ
jgi:hypothetical protein